ncbi:unnamed protein product [Cunninghamella blakesleeana]
MVDKDNMMDTDMEVVEEMKTDDIKTEDVKTEEMKTEEVKKELTPEEKKVKEKHDWVNYMRLKFCVRPDFDVTKNMIHADGTLNQDYFRPPKDQKVEEPRKWTDVERQLLIEGIEKYGIGSFGQISKELLPKWSTNDLRLKCIRLVGRQNLQLYRGWKGDEDAILAEYEKNKEVGLKYGSWKQGVLVYDDDGKVLEELKAMHEKSGNEVEDKEEDEEEGVDDDDEEQEGDEDEDEDEGGEDEIEEDEIEEDEIEEDVDME